jgi:3-deoxy-D-manno-octulosonate 8-phosphate phosphatase (KDO 8-P phosphatase)
MKVKLFVMDVDGILTDGRIIYDNKGNQLKFFDVQDGFGIALLRRGGIESAIITAKKSKVVERRAKDFKLKYLYQNCSDKLKALNDLMGKLKLLPEEICYMGDDLLDLPVLKSVGLAVTVPNAVSEVRGAVHHTTEKHGGRGAVREICDLILKTQGKFDIIPYI